MAGDDQPDIQIGAVVKAKRLRFKSKPKAEVRVTGEGGSRSERENLPDEVEPGVTYRDVKVGWLAEASLERKERSEPKDN